MREKEIEQKLAKFVKNLGGVAYKFTSPGNGGVPDRIIILKDRPAMFVELKADGGRLSDLQNFQIKRLQNLGQMVFVVKGENGLNEFKKVLEGLV